MAGIAARVGGAQRMNPARAALIEATKTLLVLRPFGGFSIDEVTREARVARGSFYNHFSDVDELVATTQSLVQAQLNTSIRAAIADSPDAATSMARGMATLMHFGYTSRGERARVDGERPRRRRPLAPRQRGADGGVAARDRGRGIRARATSRSGSW